MVGNKDVVFFFLFGLVTFGAVALRFWQSGKTPHRQFALGLGLFALAFGIWAIIVGVRPEPLDAFMSVGVLPFVAGFIALVRAATFDWLPRNRATATWASVAFLTALFLLRTFALPSTPGFSARGLIYFNAQPPILLMYILAFAGSFMTALHVVSSQINNRLLAALTRISFNLVVLSGVILMSSTDDNVQYLNGYIMLLGMLGLLIIYVPGSVKAKLAN